MRGLILLMYLFLGASLLAFKENCNPDEDCKKCVGSIPGGFNFLKSYPIDPSGKERVEFSYVLTKGTQYFLNVCDQGRNGINVNVFNSDRKTVASNLVGGKTVSGLTFNCTVTGIYYMKYTVAGMSCGGSTLSFKR